VDKALLNLPATAFLKALTKSHPRLLVSNEDFDQLKARTVSDPKLQSWRVGLKAQAEELLGAAPSKYEIPDGLRLLATSRRILDRVYTLAMIFRLEGDPRFAQRAWQELAAAEAFPDWNPRHFLDTAEMTHAFAIGYDWLYDVWTPDQQTELRLVMVQKGLKPAVAVYRAQKGWVRARNNWNQVCNGGIGMAALALAAVEPQLCAEILKGALASLPLAMDEFAPDGAWKEGPAYWNYATHYNCVFLAALESALGTDYDLSATPGFSLTGYFPLYFTGPFGRTFNYADGRDQPVHAAQTFWLARKFRKPVFAWDQRRQPKATALDILWYEPGHVGPKSVGLPLDRHFRGSEVAFFRSEWENPRALFAGFKAGDNKASHSHLDLGSFVFDALGARWAVDLGAGDYNLPGYFRAQRGTYYRLRAEGQNALVINPDAEPDQDIKASARITRFDSKPGRAFAVTDLTPAYRKHASKVWRGLALLDRRQLLVQDEIEANKPSDVWWFMHTPAAIRVDADGRAAILQQVGLQLRVEILSPDGASFQIMDAAPLPESPHPERQAKNEGVKKLAIRLKDASRTRIAVLFTPGTAESAEGPRKVVPFAEW